jgi:hypothetical protein
VDKYQALIEWFKVIRRGAIFTENKILQLKAELYLNELSPAWSYLEDE